MDIDRLGKKRTKRTQTWASVCVGLFGNRGQATDGASEATPDADDSESVR